MDQDPRGKHVYVEMIIWVLKGIHLPRYEIEKQRHTDGNLFVEASGKHIILVWNGICCSGQRPSVGTSKVIQRRQKERKIR